MTALAHNGLFPCVVMEDRYSGSYSGGPWLAIACADELVDGTATRAQFCLLAEEGPSGGDIEATTFWNKDTPAWIAAGATPDQAIAVLNGRLDEGQRTS